MCSADICKSSVAHVWTSYESTNGCAQSAPVFLIPASYGSQQRADCSSLSKAKAVCTMTPVTKFRIPGILEISRHWIFTWQSYSVIQLEMTQEWFSENTEENDMWAKKGRQIDTSTSSVPDSASQTGI